MTGRSLLLALDGGGSHTRAGLYDGAGNLLAEGSGPGSNPVAYGLDTAIHVLGEAARAAMARGGVTEVDVVTAGISGAGGGAVIETIAQQLCARLGAREAFIGGDGWPALYATTGWDPAILIISGTGCTVFVHTGGGHTFNVAGRGTLWGEDGGAYGLATAGVKAAADAIDGLASPTVLTEQLPAAAGVDSFDALIRWAGPATKADVAGLARTVLGAADGGDDGARRCVDEQASILAKRIGAGLRKAGLPVDTTPLVIVGSYIEKADRFREAVEDKIGRRFTFPALRGHGAVAALYRARDRPASVGLAYTHRADTVTATEARAAQGVALDELDAVAIAAVMDRADGEAHRAVSRALPAIAALIDRAADSIVRGGRIVYIGAGTSGRLGVLDASECPPTFGIAADRVLGIIAGGEPALRNSVEGAEDDREAGIDAMTALGITERDTVIGIAASGHTPYTRAALDEARSRGGATALVACNPSVNAAVDFPVLLDTGAEVLPGSTRLKAGTATKMVLNMISTGALAKAGYVYRGYMTSMRPVNRKLRERAVRIIVAVTGLTPDGALAALDAADGELPVAIIMGARGIDADCARERLRDAGGILRDALG